MAAFFLFPRVLFVELLDFYRFQNTRFYLYILSLFAIRLFIGQAMARRRGRQNFKTDSRQSGIQCNACKIRRTYLQKALRSGETLQFYQCGKRRLKPCGSVFCKNFGRKIV